MVNVKRCTQNVRCKFLITNVKTSQVLSTIVDNTFGSSSLNTLTFEVEDFSDYSVMIDAILMDFLVWQAEQAMGALLSPQTAASGSEESSSYASLDDLGADLGDAGTAYRMLHQLAERLKGIPRGMETRKKTLDLGDEEIVVQTPKDSSKIFLRPLILTPAMWRRGLVSYGSTAGKGIVLDHAQDPRWSLRIQAIIAKVAQWQHEARHAFAAGKLTIQPDNLPTVVFTANTKGDGLATLAKKAVDNIWNKSLGALSAASTTGTNFEEKIKQLHEKAHLQALGNYRPGGVENGRVVIILVELCERKGGGLSLKKLKGKKWPKSGQTGWATLTRSSP